MHILVTGLSHKTAPIEIREKMAFPIESQESALEELIKSRFISEGVILSTCNRTEVYTAVTDPDRAADDVVAFLCDFCGIKKVDLNRHLYSYARERSIHHLFRVVSSLDSMVLGEAQILGQVKEAYTTALERGATSVILNKLFTNALRVGKRARTETAIGESAVSVSSVAVELAKNVFEDLRGRVVMIVGAGEMSELTAQSLRDNGVTSFLVANRTYEKAVDFSQRFKAEPVRFEDLHAYMIRADIVISSTGAQEAVITRSGMHKIMQERRHSPIFLIDIAVPRDVEPDAGDVQNVFLYNIDDLKAVVDANLSERQTEAEKVEVLILEEIEDFTEWLSSLDVVPTIAELKEMAESIRNEEVEKVLNKLGDLSDKDKNEIGAMAKVILSKMLHEPVIRLKAKGEDKDQYLYVETLRYLFGLEKGKPDDDMKKRKRR